jgi:opacity protein-like surface antigen
MVKKILLAALLVFSIGAAAHAADTCSSKAIDKNGKPLAGAALTSSINKCKKDAVAACDSSAKDKNGKLLAGAAKASYTKKCVSDAVGG